MPKVSAAHMEARREQILAAAMICFAKNGLHPTTMQDICVQAGLSPGAVYRYFKGKQHIIEALALVGLDTAREIIGAARGRPETGEALRAMILDFFGLFDKRHPFYEQFGGKVGPAEVRRLNITLRAEALRSPRMLKIYHDNYRVLYGMISEVVREAQAGNLIRADLDPLAVTQVMFSFFIGLENQKSYDAGLDVERYLKVVQGMIEGLATQ